MSATRSEEEPRGVDFFFPLKPEDGLSGAPAPDFDDARFVGADFLGLAKLLPDENHPRLKSETWGTQTLHP